MWRTSTRGCEISSIVVQIWSTCNNFVMWLQWQIGQHITVHLQSLFCLNYAINVRTRSYFLSWSACCLFTCSNICQCEEIESRCWPHLHTPYIIIIQWNITICHAFIFSWLDYCESLLTGVNEKSINGLQIVKIAAARVLKTKKRQESTLL